MWKNGDVRLTILGSGTMMPTRERHPAAYLIEHGETRLLLDCGHTTVARLVEHNVDLHRIDAVAITHFHTDHFADLLPLVHARWVDDAHCGRTHRPLTVLGPRTLAARFQKLREVFWPEPKESYALTLREVSEEDEPIAIGSLAVRPFAVRHVEWFPSVGYRVEAEGRSLAYTGDLGTGQDGAFRQAIADADLLLIEAGARKPRPNHFTAEEAAELAQECGIRRVLLTHVRAEHLPHLRRVVARFPTLLTLAEDNQELEV